MKLKILDTVSKKPLSLPARGAWIEIVHPTGAHDIYRGRSPHGERGLKFVEIPSASGVIGRSPHGERGLKSLEPICARSPLESLPARGAWIEIISTTLTPSEIWRRSPHGERGLKYCGKCHTRKERMSLPARGAWIEIAKAMMSFFFTVCRSPHGERGLKCNRGGHNGYNCPVAPRTGSVD